MNFLKVGEAELTQLLPDESFRFTSDPETILKPNDRGGELWMWIGLAVVVLLLLESFLAWRFGHFRP